MIMITFIIELAKMVKIKNLNLTSNLLSLVLNKKSYFLFLINFLRYFHNKSVLLKKIAKYTKTSLKKIKN